MNIKQTKTFELSMEDIKTAITDYMFKTCRENMIKLMLYLLGCCWFQY
jgi:hypothetical protein